jgi:hypothetical protein
VPESDPLEKWVPKPDPLERYASVDVEGGGGAGEWDVGAVDVDAGLTMSYEAWRQGLTLVNFSAQCNRLLWDRGRV